MSFEMKSLTTFPMERLCFDLKLEVFEQMDPNDSIELVKANAGFRSILLRKPWLVFGQHVYWIDFDGDEILIEKFYGSQSKPAGSSFGRFDTDLHFPLIERIHSCENFGICLRNPYDHFKQFSDEQAAILKQLPSVKHLSLDVNTSNDFLTFLENFHLVIEESVEIVVSFDLFHENQVIRGLLKHFIANQINSCVRVRFDCSYPAAFAFYYDAFAKTSIKFFEFSTIDFSTQLEVVQSIVEKGIPGKNSKAAFYSRMFGTTEMNPPVLDFISRFPGMKQIVGEDQQVVAKMANELLRQYDVDSLDRTDGLYFRRNIDSSRDGVYMLLKCPESYRLRAHTGFLALYVQPQSEMMT